jgi:hypothetical protein
MLTNWDFVGKIRDSQNEALKLNNEAINVIKCAKNTLTINKHLTNIIVDYIDFRLPFINELLYNTNFIINDLQNWRYYDGVLLRVNDGKKYKIKYRIHHLKDFDKTWRITQNYM